MTYKWDIPFKNKVVIKDYTNQIIMGKHIDGRIFTSIGINIQVADRDLKNPTVLWDARAEYPGYTVDKMLLLPSGTMLLRLTNWKGQGHILRSNDLTYTSFTSVFTGWKGEMLFRSWSCNEQGIVIASEYPTIAPIQNVDVWKAINDGRDWTLLKRFGGREGVTPEIFHTHCCQYDKYSGLWWISTGDTNSESRVYTTDGNTLELVASGSQLYRAVSFSFNEGFVLWGTDGTMNNHARQVRYNRITKEIIEGEWVDGYIFVTEVIDSPNQKRPLIISDGHKRWVSNTIQLSNNGRDWYNAFTWQANPNTSPFPAFNNFVDNGDGRFYAYTTSLLRHDTGEPFNNGTVIFEIV